jgi:hypothetical protein
MYLYKTTQTQSNIKQSLIDWLKGTMIAVIMLIITTFGIRAMGSTWYVDGKEVTKGEALIAKARDAKRKVVKQDEMEISDKGTLKAVKVQK